MYAGLGKANIPNLLKESRDFLQSWALQEISWLGRISAIKMCLLPRLLYTFHALPIVIPEQDLLELQKEIGCFIWQGKTPRLRRKLLTRGKMQGGLGLPSIPQYYRAAKVAAILGWMDPMESPKWRDI